MIKIPLTATHNAILGAWRCAFADERVIYLSGPISTGARYLEAVRAGEKNLAIVARDNSEALSAAARRLRLERNTYVVEPASLSVPGWSQEEYLLLWEHFIERQVRIVVFMPGWAYSIGCITEYQRAVKHGVTTESLSGAALTTEDALAQLKMAATEVAPHAPKTERLSLLLSTQARTIEYLERLERPSAYDVKDGGVFKDTLLDRLAQKQNVAQFVSFGPVRGKPEQRYSRIRGETPNHSLGSVRAAAELLLTRSPERSVNVRSYEPKSPQSREFIYGLRSVDEVVAAVARLTSENLHTIINETVDVADGGVSGVVMGNIIEFAPDDTPRAVEKPGTAMFPRDWGQEALSQIYGVPLSFNFPLSGRLEFSIHPRPRGWLHTNSLAWEYSEGEYVPARARVTWPNRFSRLIGDKAFGLLVAHFAGLPVPQTTVISRRISPFSFGLPTGSGETWIRTAPVEQVPGKYTTHRGWIDPFELLHREDTSDNGIASVLAQDGISPNFSGALIVDRGGDAVIEGKEGEGETLMLGMSGPEKLPSEVSKSVIQLFEQAKHQFGPVRFEWVHDGIRPWIVQMHSGVTDSIGNLITNEPAESWIEFDTKRGLESLRSTLETLRPGTGIALSGNVGLTSHFADVLRKARVPAKISA